jgi:hypothetical protein
VESTNRQSPGSIPEVDRVTAVAPDTPTLRLGAAIAEVINDQLERRQTGVDKSSDTDLKPQNPLAFAAIVALTIDVAALYIYVHDAWAHPIVQVATKILPLILGAGFVAYMDEWRGKLVAASGRPWFQVTTFVVLLLLLPLVYPIRVRLLIRERAVLIVDGKPADLRPTGDPNRFVLQVAGLSPRTLLVTQRDIAARADRTDTLRLTRRYLWSAIWHDLPGVPAYELPVSINTTTIVYLPRLGTMQGSAESSDSGNGDRLTVKRLTVEGCFDPLFAAHLRAQHRLLDNPGDCKAQMLVTPEGGGLNEEFIKVPTGRYLISYQLSDGTSSLPLLVCPKHAEDQGTVSFQTTPATVSQKCPASDQGLESSS